MTVLLFVIDSKGDNKKNLTCFKINHYLKMNFNCAIQNALLNLYNDHNTFIPL